MPRGPSKKPLCACQTCKKCKDRARIAAKKAGTFVRYQAQGRKAEHEAAAKRAAKEAAKKTKAILDRLAAKAKEAARA